MLALEEKVRMVMLLMPDLVLEGKGQEIVDMLEEAYLEVKARKEIFLNEAESGSYFHHLPAEERDAATASASRGLCEVLVLEHLDGDVVERFQQMLAPMTEKYGAGSFYESKDKWECKRDLEFFFPALDALPVERTLCVIKPTAMAATANGKTLAKLVEEEAASLGLFVVGKRQATLSQIEAQLLCKEYEGTADQAGAAAVLKQEPGCLAMILEGRGAIGKLQLSCGPLHAGTAKMRAPTTLRALFGTDSTSNAVHASLDMEGADNEIAALFPDGTLNVQRTLCIVKPDAIANLMAIRTEIGSAGFTILKEKQTTLTEERAKEFYRDLAEEPSFSAIVKEASSGPCCAMVLCRLEAVSVWKQLMGDESVKEARKQSPGSLRARFGRDGQRNAVHGSDSVKAAALEIRFFFPEMSADPLPDDNEVRDFLFRKSAVSAMDLKTLSDAEATNFQADPTLQQLLSSGLVGLCQTKPHGLKAAEWLSSWLEVNNPNTKVHDFFPPERSKQFVDYGMNRDGMAFAVEAPRKEASQKPVVEVDLEEMKASKEAEFSSPPYVVFVAGGPGTGKGTQCAKIRDECNFVHLSSGDLMREEVAAETFLGGEIQKHMAAGSLVPDEVVLTLLKKAMVKHQDTNRFLLDGFPRSVDQAIRFEKEVAEVSFMLFLDCSEETMKTRIMSRAASNPGRVDDNEATVLNRLKVFKEQTMPLVEYYEPIGKLRKTDSEKTVDEVAAEVKRFFSCRFLYLVGPPVSPCEQMAERLETKYGYSAINVNALLKSYVAAGEAEAAGVKKAMAAGKPVDASIACPLVLAEIHRDMALGVQNFVLCDFPQSLKQVQFLEYRVPCTSRTLVLDFSKADAADLAGMAADPVMLEKKAFRFFGPETTEMLSAMSNVERVHCSLHEMQITEAPGDSQVLDGTWSALQSKIMPAISIVLGLPCSGADVLTKMLAKAMPNTQAVDCNQLLDKELERQTEIGITMHNMLAKGQVVPLSMTLELLKGVINLTSSDALVIEGCPMYVDQIELIQKEFKIEKVFYIAGNEQAVGSWKSQYVEAGGEDAAAQFAEREERLPAIVAHFSRMGKLERFEFSETAQEAQLEMMLEKATMPQFAVVSSLSPVIAAQQADLLCAAYGSKPVSNATLLEFATARKMTPDLADAEQFTKCLKMFAKTSALPLLVLQNCPGIEATAQAFLETFGAPKIVVNVECDDEFLDEEYKGLHEDEEIDAEALAAKLAENRTAMEGMLKVFKEACPANCMMVDRKVVTKPEDVTDMAKKKLMPTVYVLMSPSACSKMVADSICTSAMAASAEDLPPKFTVLDASMICKKGGGSPALEEALTRASFNAPTPDCLPVKLWADLLLEFFAKSPNPMGTFLLTNFPTPSTVGAGETIRDQLAVIESVATVAGFAHVKLSAGSFASMISQDPMDFETYQSFDTTVYDQILAQFGPKYLMDFAVQEGEAAKETAMKVAAEFFTFQGRSTPDMAP